MTHSPDPYNLQRFVNAQRGESIGASYAQALSEIRRGKKLSDWIWYIFPIFLGVRDSSTWALCNIGTENAIIDSV